MGYSIFLSNPIYPVPFCSFHQIYKSNERKTILVTNIKLCRTQASFNSLNYIYNKKVHMLNIFYSLKTINFLKIKRVVLKHGAQLVYLVYNSRPECTPWFEITQIKTTYRVNPIEKFLKGKVIWCNINSPFRLNITCSINIILNPNNHNLSEIMYKEKTLNKTLSTFTVFKRNLTCTFQKSSKHFISHTLQ